MARLKFKDLKEDMFIYRINPFTAEIEGNRVQQVKGIQDELLRGEHPDSAKLKHYVRITCYMRELVVHSPEIEKVPTFDLILDGRLEFQLGNTKIEGFDILFPVPYSPNEKTLKEFKGE